MPSHQPAPSSESSTRENILRVTSGLLVARGYRGTSTRDIAEAVGIRQPSLFHHFESKRAILEELLDRDLGAAMARLGYFTRLEGPVAPRLYAYVLADYRALAATAYDVRSIYTSDLLSDPEFGKYRSQLHEFFDLLAALIEDGIGRNELRPIQPVHGQQAIAGMFYAALWADGWLTTEARRAWPEASAEIVLRGILRRPTDFPRIKRVALRLLDTMPADAAIPAYD